jgi:hypothetical protein
MKNTYLLILSLLFISNAAFAIDQVTTKSGEVIQGKVLSEEANLHVDIETTNGAKRRIPYSEVASVDRDVPSNEDRSMVGIDERTYLSILGGGYYVISNGGANNNVLFNYGARFGVNTAQLGSFSKLGFALSYDRASTDNNLVTSSVNDIMFEILFKKVGNSGFYFGPEAGIAIRGISLDGQSDSSTASSFAYGALAGFDAYLNSSFSIGPEFHIDHLSQSTVTLDSGSSAVPSLWNIKFLLSATFHFD